MKTFFEKLFVHFDFIAHPAAGWSANKEDDRKRKGKKKSTGGILSPDSFHMRGPASKKQGNHRKTPAP